MNEIENNSMQLRMSRRQFLLASSALLSFPLLKGCNHNWMENDERISGIDVHCHVFNASDLSISGFVQRVLLKDYEDQVIFEAQEALQESFFAGLAGLLVKIISLPSITAKDEYSSMLSPESAISSQLEPAEQSRQLQRILSEVIAPMPAPPGSPTSGEIIYNADYSVLLQEIKKEIAPLNPGKSDQELSSPETMAESLVESNGFIGRYIQCAINMLSSRSMQVERLTKLYGGKSGIQLFTPALVDFEYWLNESPRSPFADQIAVMDLIQRRQTGGAMVHSFAPFDPWRQIIDEDEGNPTALELAQHAVMDAGFVGVKLYPPMGFYPTENTKHRLGVPNRAEQIPNFPKRMDKALAKLYAWCKQEGVPIMAHATNSNDATNGASERANPKSWEPALRDHPGLQVNLGHFGGFDEVLDGHPATSSWEWAVGQLLNKNHHGVYADMSYMSEFLGDKASKQDRDTIKQNLASFITKFDPKLQHLLYGSDWIMMGKEPDHEKYPRIVFDLLNDIGINKQQMQNYFTNNAINYLGLARGKPTRQRLEKYYMQHGLDNERLKILAG